MFSTRQTLHWTDISSWESIAWEALNPIVDEEVLEAFLQSPPEYVVGDDLSWLDGIIERVTGLNVDSKHFMAEALSTHFSHIRAVHGSRTDDVGSFLREGLRPLDIAQMNESAADIFLSGGYPELEEQDLAQAIEKMRTQDGDSRGGRVFFEANERHLVEHCGHYMLYGSEYLIGVAARLKGNGRDYRRVLKERGQPVLFRCDVPMEMLPNGILSEFAGSALEFIFERKLNPDYQEFVYRGAGFPIYQALAPEFIVEYITPEIKRDPIMY